MAIENILCLHDRSLKCSWAGGWLEKFQKNKGRQNLSSHANKSSLFAHDSVFPFLHVHQSFASVCSVRRPSKICHVRVLTTSSKRVGRYQIMSGF